MAIRKLTPEEKRNIWRGPSRDNNLGMGWDSRYAARPRRYQHDEDEGTMTPTLDLDPIK